MHPRWTFRGARLITLFCLAGLFAAAGCGPRLVDVRGQVTVNGKPLTDAVIFFAPNKMDCGHNREPVFLDDEDFGAFLGLVDRYRRRFGCRVYYYCLMTNWLGDVAR
jgi:hypothetical protein